MAPVNTVYPTSNETTSYTGWVRSSYSQVSAQSCPCLLQCIDCQLKDLISMAKVHVARYGSWVSPITSDEVVKEAISLSKVSVDPFDQDAVYWTEARPEEGGRIVVCCFSEGGDAPGSFTALTPKDFNCRTTVHEYGGAAHFVYKKHVYFSNFGDQRLYRQKVKGEDGAYVQEAPVPITPSTPAKKQWRYADGMIALDDKVLVCVREDHKDLTDLPDGTKEATNTIISINLHSEKQFVLESGHNFYSSPRVNKNGSIAWIQWKHPNMPWDDTELWVGELTNHGHSIKHSRKVVSGLGVSVMLPKWSSDDKLLYISDETDWWNLYRLDGDAGTNLCPKAEEIGGPTWTFGKSAYDCDPTGSGNILLTYGKALSVLKPSGQVEPIDTGYASHSQINYSPDGKNVFMIVGGPTEFAKIVKLNIADGKVSVLRKSITLNIDVGYYSIPEEISWDTTGGAVSHGYYYAPKNKDYQAPGDTCPPLLVKVHGGPTSACSPVLNLSRQYFTSRGFALLDVNYRGSTGYGRKYRDMLKPNWGFADVDDCCAGARHLVEKKLADENYLAIDGGSAGGYTTLSCLTFKDTFTAGTSNYGVSDLEALVKDTHKFESRYVDKLVGEYPEDIKEYHKRSPIYHVNKLKVALAIFQGDEDEIVPPNQAEMMYDAVKKNGYPVAYTLFKGEQHGFRKAENIKFALDGEFYFYSKVFGFEAPGIDVDLEIENLPE